MREKTTTTRKANSLRRSLSFEFRVSFYSFDTLNSCVSFFVFFFPFLYHLFLTTLTQKNVHKEEEEPKH